MHILYIHQYFATPQGSTGTRSYEFARRWIKAGHKVTVITGNCEVNGLETGREFFQKQIIEQINIVIVGIKYSNKQSSLQRIMSFLYFVCFSIFAGLQIRDVDVIYATSTPLTIGIPAMLLKWLKHVPFVFEVRDQWPEVPVEMGIIRNRFVIRCLLRLEKTIYKQSSAIVALSPGMANGVRSVLKETKKNITIIPNSSDTELFHPQIDGTEIRQEQGWADKLVFLHAGVMGRANGLNFVIDVAEKLRHNHDIHFVLIGDGKEKTALIERIAQNGLTNVDILAPVVKTKLPEYFAACDVAMVIFAGYPILEHNSANKFFDSLSAGKPILLNYSGWQRDVLKQNNAGFGCKLCNVDEFAEKVLYLDSHRNDLVELGRNARQLAIEKFDRQKLAMQALAVITSI